MAGSSDRYSSSTRNCPSSGSGAGSSTYSQSEDFGRPTGRAAKRHWALSAVTLVRLPDGSQPRPRPGDLGAEPAVAADDVEIDGHAGALGVLVDVVEQE